MPESNFSQESVMADDSGFLLALVGFDLNFIQPDGQGGGILRSDSGLTLVKPLLLLFMGQLLRKNALSLLKASG